MMRERRGRGRTGGKGFKKAARQGREGKEKGGLTKISGEIKSERKKSRHLSPNPFRNQTHQSPKH